MSWLAPLGFIGLIGIVALIVIYIIKPNYQQKVITSTFVWRRSLKFRKKKLPVSKLQNLLIFLCQLLILTTLGLLLARPVVMNEKIGDENEKIIIIDASASMLIEEQGSTRFARAIDEAKLLVSATYEQGGVVSVILADDTPEFIAQRYGSDMHDDVIAALDELMTSESCSYSSADMDKAIDLSEEVLRYNNEAQIHLYTATKYLEKNDIIVKNMLNAINFIISEKPAFNKDNLRIFLCVRII